MLEVKSLNLMVAVVSSLFPARFRGEDKTLWSFTGRVDVVCPRCGKAAVVSQTETERRFVCVHCGANRVEKPTYRSFCQRPLPAWCGYRLLLQTPCRGEVLWALNREHLEYLRSYIAAEQRGREQLRPHEAGVSQVLKPISANQHVTSRLPRWMVLKTSRADVLKGLERLEARLGHS